MITNDEALKSISFIYALARNYLRDNICDENEKIKVGKLDMSLLEAINTVMKYLEEKENN